MELWSIESIKQCVAANLGISFLPRFAVERELMYRSVERAAVWRAVAIDHGAVRPSCRESGQPGNADIYAVYGGVFYRGR
ncbi:LysR substrate-binding domain-containing protein [Salmonella enterica]|uniref:LysR substrate-binding domain-containing protein n=1 Tax=Salmonella enterica TaxID=28901 RepID=UPI003B43A4CF